MVDPSVASYRVDDQLILARQGSRQIHVLNDVGRWVWEQLTKERSLADVAKAVAITYDVSVVEARRDIAALVRQFRRLGLVAGGNKSLSDKAAAIAPSPPKAGIGQFPAPLLHKTYMLADCAVRIGVDSRIVLHRFAPLTDHLVATTSDPDCSFNLWADGDRYRVSVDGGPGESYRSLDHAISYAVRDMAVIASRHGTRLMILHAGAVRMGRAGLLLAGLGGKGKTTLTTALALSGFDYLGDDTIPIDADSGEIVPLTISPCLKQGSWDVLAEFDPSLRELPVFDRVGQPVKYASLRGETPNRLHARVKPVAMVFPTWTQGAVTRLTPISRVEAIRELAAANSAFGVEDDPRNLEAILNWLNGMALYSLIYSDLRHAVDVLGEVTSAAMEHNEAT